MSIKFLAKTLSLSPSQIIIVRGQHGRKKIIRIDGMSTSEFFKKNTFKRIKLNPEYNSVTQIYFNF